MRKLAALILLSLMLFNLAGCGKEQQYKQPISFYYKTANLSYDAVCSTITPEIREGADLQSTQDILNLYFAGPNSDSMVSPFPADLTLISCQLDEDTLYLIVSDELAALSGIDLTLACCCMTLTCLSVTDADTVCIQAETALLGGQKSITMDTDAFLLLDSSDQNTNS